MRPAALAAGALAAALAFAAPAGRVRACDTPAGRFGTHSIETLTSELAADDERRRTDPVAFEGVVERSQTSPSGTELSVRLTELAATPPRSALVRFARPSTDIEIAQTIHVLGRPAAGSDVDSIRIDAVAVYLPETGSAYYLTSDSRDFQRWRTGTLTPAGD